LLQPQQVQPSNATCKSKGKEEEKRERGGTKHFLIKAELGHKNNMTDAVIDLLQ
jgi:hypothetical protein